MFYIAKPWHCYNYAKQVGQLSLISTVAQDGLEIVWASNQTCWNQLLYFTLCHVIMKKLKMYMNPPNQQNKEKSKNLVNLVFIVDFKYVSVYFGAYS